MANCYARCGTRTPAVDATQITEEIMEPDADIIAELMEQVHQLRYDYPMDIQNILNYPGETPSRSYRRRMKFSPIFVLLERNKARYWSWTRMMIAESRQQLGCMRRKSLWRYFISSFSSKIATNQSICNGAQAAKCSNQAWNGNISSNDSAQLFSPQVASSFKNT